MLSHKQRGITNFVNRNDIFYTPTLLASVAISMVPTELASSTWLDPCKGKGAYYDQFPATCTKDFCEITESIDFFHHTARTDVVISNPPYSLIDAWLSHTLTLKPQCINYLIGIHNLTTKRLETMEAAGYRLTKIHLCKVHEWFGMSVIVQWEHDKGQMSGLTYDRVVWR